MGYRSRIQESIQEQDIGEYIGAYPRVCRRVQQSKIEQYCGYRRVCRIRIQESIQEYSKVYRSIIEYIQEQSRVYGIQVSIQDIGECRSIVQESIQDIYEGIQDMRVYMIQESIQDIGEYVGSGYGRGYRRIVEYIRYVRVYRRIVYRIQQYIGVQYTGYSSIQEYGIQDIVVYRSIQQEYGGHRQSIQEQRVYRI